MGSSVFSAVLAVCRVQVLWRSGVEVLGQASVCVWRVEGVRLWRPTLVGIVVAKPR